jgi:hypothetical protein
MTPPLRSQKKEQGIPALKTCTQFTVYCLPQVPEELIIFENDAPNSVGKEPFW